MTGAEFTRLGPNTWIAPVGTPIPLYDLRKPRVVRQAECRRDGHAWARVTAGAGMAVGFECTNCRQVIDTRLATMGWSTPPPDMGGLDPFTAAVALAVWRGLFPEGAR